MACLCNLAETGWDVRGKKLLQSLEFDMSAMTKEATEGS
jgi:hypothetical protein